MADNSPDYRAGLSDGRFGYPSGSGIDVVNADYRHGYERGCLDRKAEPERFYDMESKAYRGGMSDGENDLAFGTSGDAGTVDYRKGFEHGRQKFEAAHPSLEDEEASAPPSP